MCARPEDLLGPLVRLAALAAVFAPGPSGAAPASSPSAPEATAARIIDWPIQFGPQRIALTRRYIARHYGLRVEHIRIRPIAVVIHWTGTRSLRPTWRAFNRVRMRAARRHLIRGGLVNVSAHFLVARDGTIYRLMPETWMARHCIGLNYDAIGIENLGGGRRWPLTRAQLRADAALVRYLAGRHPIRYLLGHMEWRRFEHAPFFRERDPTYRNAKPDPGRRFMHRLRRAVAPLHLSDRYRSTPPGQRSGGTPESPHKAQSPMSN